MLYENQDITVKWNCFTKKHYEDRGYKFTKINEEFIVKVEDLQPNSSAKVEVSCDYCNRKIIRTYKNHIIQSKRGNDCCSNCVNIKIEKTMIKKYGVSHPMKSKEFIDKQNKTVLDRYGVNNISNVSWIQEKKIKTNNEKYGKDWFTQSEKFESICEEKFGVKNPLKSKEILEKRNNSFIKNNTTPKSKEELRLCDIFKDVYGEENCKTSYIHNNFIIDCLLTINNIKIDIEYDGWYWHKSRIKYDRARDEVLKKDGFKILRIRSFGDMPTKEQIIEAINYLMSDNNSYTCINLNI